MPSDARGRLGSDPFVHLVTKDGSVRISRGGRTVATVRGSAAGRLIAAIAAGEDDNALQHLLARATGNYRRGKERHG